jgi:glycosyltransferase involved in cell wall biosynthesis
MKICFLDNTKFKYNFNDKYSPLLRGAETILINLSKSISLLGHEVFVFNNCNESINGNNYSWNNINQLTNKRNFFDVVIVNADANLFDLVSAQKKVVLSYSLQPIEKFIRKKQLLPYIKHRPKIFLLGEYHKKNRSILTSLFGSEIFTPGIDDIFTNCKIEIQKHSNQAIFTSRSDRNLTILIEIWKKYILPKSKNYKLLITPYDINEEELKKENIYFRKMNLQGNLISDLLSSKMMLVPGHKAELFCLAAEEARELCLPIITLGIGSLKERVDHGKTGFIANNYSEFAQYTLDLFQQDDLYNNIVRNLLELRGSKSWLNAAKNFLNSI